MREILVLNGPNLNRLGKRDQKVYGALTLEEINLRLEEASVSLGVNLRFFQSNHEGELVEKIHDAEGWADGVVLNAAAYTHTSVALRDAIECVTIPVVEVHLSNVYARETFRQKSMIAPVCRGVIAGFGWTSYLLAVHALIELMSQDI